MEEKYADLFKAIEHDKAYDFIANNYMNFSKSDLKDVLLEFIYGFYKLSKGEEYSLVDVMTEVMDRMGFYDEEVKA